MMEKENNWCLPGGILFGIYSGPSCYKEYPNGDNLFSIQIVFHTKTYCGALKQEDAESFEHSFFHCDHLPSPLNQNQAAFILDWAEGKQPPIVR
jgi:hypothetical protein